MLKWRCSKGTCVGAGNDHVVGADEGEFSSYCIGDGEGPDDGDGDRPGVDRGTRRSGRFFSRGRRGRRLLGS